ncbi:MAG: DUF427 domain-containing protein [Naasia sp.]
MRSARIKPDKPGPGQESVWDYPRPPRVEKVSAAVEIRLGGRVIARSDSTLRVLETSHPPVYYVPVEDFEDGVLRPTAGASWCEYKGQAAYFDLVAGETVAAKAAWGYPTPSPGYGELVGTVAVYPGRVDSCTVGDETVRAQAGDFYGGWITSGIVGPFKGEPGTQGW